jgi:hypothetical protein
MAEFHARLHRSMMGEYVADSVFRAIMAVVPENVDEVVFFSTLRDLIELKLEATHNVGRNRADPECKSRS